MRPSRLSRWGAATAPGRWGWWLALAIALGALVVIVLRPHRTVPVAAGTGVLVTAGATPDDVTRVLDSLGSTRVARTAGYDDGQGIPVVRDLEQVRTLYPELSHVIVLGWGLEPPHLNPLPIGITPLPSPTPTGFRAITVDAPRGRTGPTTILGAVDGGTPGDSVHLSGVAGEVGASVLAPDGSFRLSWQPRAGGPNHLLLAHAPMPGSDEPLRIGIDEPMPGAVLLLDDAPSFETSSLRRWLIAAGASVVHRTRLSREVVRVDRDNAAATTLGTLTRERLQPFDLVVLDAGVIESLEARERVALEVAVREDGLGVLIVGDGAGGNAAGSAFFAVAEWERFPALERRTVRPAWPPTGGPSASVPLTTAPAALAARFGTKTVIEDGLGGDVAQVVIRGAGRIGTIVSLESSRWQRRGETEAYTKLWNTILSSLMRDPPERERWRVIDALPAVDRQLRVVGLADDDRTAIRIATPAGTEDTVSVGPDRDGALRGWYWPRQSGWHRFLSSSGGQVFYVYPREAWRGVTATRRRDATLAAAALAPPTAVPARSSAARPIGLTWAFIVFLAAVSVMWLGEDRFGTSRNGGTG